MVCNIDLRYGVPPLIHFFFFFFQFPQLNNPWDWDLHYFSSLLVIAIAISIFLSISVKIPLTFSGSSLMFLVQVGDFSAPVTVTLLCSILLPDPHFWIAYFITISISPCFYYTTCTTTTSLPHLLRCFFLWFVQTLQSVPTTVYIICSPSPQHGPPSPVEVLELAAMEAGFPLQQQQPSNLQHDDDDDEFVVLIDG